MPATPTIIDYLGERREPFSSIPLTEVDSLVLSTIAYFYFEKGMLGRVGPHGRMPLPLALCGVPLADLFGTTWVSRMEGEPFLHALLTSSRFMGLQVGDYVTEISEVNEKQFAAVTFYLPGVFAYVAFRGTDNTIVGWKEDFNISYMEAVPSQQRARAYLHDIAMRCDCPLYVGGHSKGGNLAEYAALTCDDAVFERIVGVFSHDGPAFANDPSPRMGTEAYRAKLHKTLPESSVFGMIMEKRDDLLHFVHADGVLFLQHASTRWAVQDGAFVQADALTPDAEVIDRTFNSWALSYEPEQRELLVNAVFDILGASSATTWQELGRDYLGNGRAVVEAAIKLPPELRGVLFGMFADIAKVFGNKTLEMFFENVPALPIPQMPQMPMLQLPTDGKSAGHQESESPAGN